MDSMELYPEFTPNVGLGGSRIPLPNDPTRRLWAQMAPVQAPVRQNPMLPRTPLTQMYVPGNLQGMETQIFGNNRMHQAAKMHPELTRTPQLQSQMQWQNDFGPPVDTGVRVGQGPDMNAVERERMNQPPAGLPANSPIGAAYR